jgi:hypothetical protein
MGRRGVDTGIEIELGPKNWSYSLSLGNGTDSGFDGNRGKSVTTRLAWQDRVKKNNLSLGLNGRINDASPGESTKIVGLFGAFSRGQVTWLAEADLVENANTGLAVSQELSFLFKQGIEIVYNHDFWDPDIKVRSGFETRQRLSLDYIPYHFFSLQPGLAFYRTNDGRSNEDWFLFDLQFYFFM